MQEIITVLQDLITRFGLNIIAAIVIFIVGRWVASLVRQLVRRLMSKGEVDVTLTAFASTLAYYGVMTFVVIAALNRLGIQTASVIAVLGAAGLAVGLALQGSLANFAAGVLVILFRPFSIGDLIEGAGELGTVQDIQLFTTTLLTPENKRVIIPNATLTASNIINISVEGKLRVDTVIGVAYDANIDQVKGIISEVLLSDPLVLREPAPTVAVMELADSSVNFAVRPWAKPENYWDVYFNTYENVKKRLDAEDISIPFPQRDVHIFQNN